MPFIAVHPDAGRVDATQPYLGCSIDWAQIYDSGQRKIQVDGHSGSWLADSSSPW